MPSFEVNRRYYGPNNAAVLILAIDGDDVTVMRPLSGNIVHMTVEQVEAWKVDSDRRIYYPANPDDRRTKIATYPDPDDDTNTLVQYFDVNGNLNTINLSDWTTWVNSLST